MKSAVFLDLDGTLWEHEEVPVSALKAIETARKNGHLVFANTGRSRSSGYPPLKDLPLDGYVFSAGSEIVKDGKTIYFRPLDETATRELKERLDALDLGYAAEGSRETFANEKDKEFLKSHIGVNRISSLFLNLPDPKDMTDEDFRQTMKFSIQIPTLEPIADLMEKYDLEFTPFAFRIDGLMTGELTQKSMSKATAMDEVRKLTDPSLRTVAIGDSENDIPMLKAADLGIAMGNGTPDAKEAANWVTAPIDEDGLAKAFEYAGLLEPLV